MGIPRLACVLALALAASGCGALSPTPELVFLAPRVDMYTPGCHTSFTVGKLIVHAATGTAVVQDEDERVIPIRWPAGFSGRRVGTEVEIRNADGRLIATTGQRYRLAGGYGEDGWRGCDDVHPSP